MNNPLELDHLKDLLLSGDSTNFELVMQIIRSMNIDRWATYSNILEAREFLANKVYGIPRNIPDFISVMRKIQLNLERRQLSYLPTCLMEFDKIMEFVSLENNLFTHIPAPILTYRHLQHLNLGNNRIGELPSSFWNYPELRHLNLRNNILNEISPDIEKFHNLEYLDVRSTHYIQLPSTLSNLKKLHTLYWGLSMYDENKAPHISITDNLKIIAACKSLKELHLNIPHWEHCPNSIGLLSNLQHLCLNYGKLKDLPESLRDLKNLQSLDLNGQALSNIPFVLTQLPNLRRLCINSSMLKQVPEYIGGLHQLEYLQLPHTIQNTENILRLKSALPNTKLVFINRYF